MKARATPPKGFWMALCPTVPEPRVVQVLTEAAVPVLATQGEQ